MSTVIETDFYNHRENGKELNLPTYYILMSLNKVMETLLPPGRFSMCAPSTSSSIQRLGLLRICLSLTRSLRPEPQLQALPWRPPSQFRTRTGFSSASLIYPRIRRPLAGRSMYSPSRARELRTQMAERRMSTNNATTKQAVYLSTRT
jgi:hypothetical protein